MNKIAIVGVTGYTGIELGRILLNHGSIELSVFTSDTYKGRSLSDVVPCFAGIEDRPCAPMDPDIIASEANIAFLCLPHGTSMEMAPKLLERGMKVIDLSGDYRFRNAQEYSKWYKQPHKNPHLLKEAVYGMHELFGEDVRRARLVSNPGCYPTSVILSLAPLFYNGIEVEGTIVADSKSGVSGAGRKPSQRLHYPECNESFSPYSTGVHRHQPEMEEGIERFCSRRPSLLFSPHLVPMNRGILSSIYINLKQQMELKEIHSIYREFYHHKPFVKVLNLEEFPSTKNVRGSNYCHIGMTMTKNGKTLVLFAAIDNLVKGASGQAVQNMNILLDLPETLGLQGVGLCV
jgi:N-acetyl-gamma-glutamyl-phosphate reductase